MSAEQEDTLLNEATHAAGGEFTKAGVPLTTDELYRLNDFLTGLLSDVQARA